MTRIAIFGVENAAPELGARVLLMGCDAVVADATVEARIGEELDRARAALPALYDVGLPPEGKLIRAESPDAAVASADAVVMAHAPDHFSDPHEGCVTLIVGQPDRGGAFLALELCSPAWLLPGALIRDASTDRSAAEAVLDRIGMDVGSAPDTSRSVMAACGGDVAAAVAALRALKARRAGPGVAIAAHEARLSPTAPSDLSVPPVTVARQVPPDWVDYNGHMNEARYLTAFSDGADRLLAWAGMDAACVAEGHSVFTVETHIRHIGEVHIGDRIEVTTRVIAAEGKRLHLWHELSARGTLAATGEQLLLHVDLATRRTALPRADVGAWLSRAAGAQAGLPWPDGAGRHVGAPKG
ncbi:hypothetical protein HKCCE2091_14600 [Rhodobacterales bacterium HKCCE2091]|nr:hypothetical protein [Rhodobacterales bacterium HKCCE2091]